MSLSLGMFCKCTIAIWVDWLSGARGCSMILLSSSRFAYGSRLIPQSLDNLLGALYIASNHRNILIYYAYTFLTNKRDFAN